MSKSDFDVDPGNPADMKGEIRTWFGQSLADKLVTGALGIVIPMAGWLSTKVTSAMVQQLLIYITISGFLALLLLLHLNRRLARMQTIHQRNENLIHIVGYIVRHQIIESPRSTLNRRVLFADPNYLEHAVADTMQAHRHELTQRILKEHPGFSPLQISELLDVFYPSSEQATENGYDKESA